MGAEIIRVERPKTAADPWDDFGADVLCRGRRRIELDLKTEAGSALALAAKADVVLEGMRPGVMERLGLGPQECHAVNPRLVYGRMTGWGQTGPLARLAGHDLNYLAITGVLNAIGPADHPPPVPLNMIGDYGGGAMFLVAGVLAALLSARSSGRGQVVDAAMTDGVAALSAFFHAFRANGQWSEAREDNLLDGAAPYYRCYRCADGGFVAVGALEPQFYQLLLDGLGLSLEENPQADRSKWPQIIRRFEERFSSRSRDDWAARFENSDACVTPVLTWSEAARHPHNIARNALPSVDGLVQPAPAPRFSATPSAIRPQTQTTLREVLAAWD